MQPKSKTVLLICVVFALAAFACGVLMDFKILDPHMVWIVVKNGGPLAALAFGIVHYFRAQPKVFRFVSDDWSVQGNPPTWEDVWIRILKSQHGKGDTPSVTFLTHSGYTKSDIGLTYRIEENGDIMIHHQEDRFMQPWRSFAVKVSV